MEAREVSAKTVDEAVELALKEMGLSRSDVTIEVLQEGKRGLLGWGGEEAKVKVTPLAPIESEQPVQKEPEQSASTTGTGTIDITAREVVEKLLALMEVPATVKVQMPDDGESPVTLEINGDDPGILIGRRGQSLSALQYMVNFIASRQHKSGVRVVIDVAGYRRRRQEELTNMALRIADLVKTKSRSITLEPMLAWERRAVHITLRDDTEITTGSVGFGDRRKVVVSPRKKRN